MSEALVRGGSDTQRQAWLPAMTRGECIGAVALAEGAGALRPESIQTRYNAGRLHGAVLGVGDGLNADLLLVLAQSGGESGQRLLRGLGTASRCTITAARGRCRQSVGARGARARGT